MRRRLKNLVKSLRRRGLVAIGAVLAIFGIGRKNRVVVNCGGHQSRFVDDLHAEFDPLWQGWVHTFEPNPAFWPGYAGMPRHTLHGSAVWTSEGTMTFYLQDRAEAQGHSLLKEKSNINPDKTLEVKCVDFARWLRETVKDADDVIVRIDIEGAEYDVLEHLIATGAIDLIDLLLVEFHHRRHPAIATEERYQNILSQIRVPFREIEH